MESEFNQPDPDQPKGLNRIPQLIGVGIAAASVIILFAAYWLPGMFSDSPATTVDISNLQATSEAEARALVTSELSLSDLAPVESPAATLTPGSASGAAGSGTETPAPAATPSTVPQRSDCKDQCVKVGVSLEDFPGDFESIARFAEMSDRVPDMVMFFQAWGDTDGEFKDWLPQLDELGVAPLITWEPWKRSEFVNQTEYTNDAIIAGDFDAYIDNWAQQAADYGKPIYLRFAHEMNTPVGKTYWYPWQGDPEAYIAVWRHVHERFVAARATNVQWIWSVAWMNSDARLYYPGDQYVDWVAVTVLNFGAGKPDGQWQSFEDLYGIQQAEILSYDKPVMISELATAEQGGDKGQWIANIGPALQQFPEIRAIVWLDYSTSREFDAINWQVNSSPAALEGWWNLMHDPYIAK